MPTGLLRKIGSIGEDIKKVFVRRIVNMKLNPASGLNKCSDNSVWNWESSSYDPQFLIYSEIPKGWVKISWSGCSEGVRYLRLYIDYGTGFNEETAITFGIIGNGKPVHREAVLYLAPSVRSLRIDPGDFPGKFNLSDVCLTGISRIEVFRISFSGYLKDKNIIGDEVIKKAWKVFARDGIKGLWDKAKQLSSDKSMLDVSKEPFSSVPYQRYVPQEEDAQLIERNISNFAYNPLISVIVPVYNGKAVWLEKSINSVLKQSYTNWELILVDSGSTSEDTRKILEKYKNHTRVKTIFTAEKSNISVAITSAFKELEGEFFTLLDQEDMLSKHSLYYVIDYLNRNNDIDVLYSDEDRVTEDNDYYAPFYKENYPLEASMYEALCTRLGVFRVDLLKQLDNYYADSQVNSYQEFIVKLVGKANSACHIPEVLYHRRSVPSPWISNLQANEQEIKPIAFYLPQFHPIPENDEWWGKGFTEWTNVTKGKPMFDGHYQPHFPADLGYYDLRVPEVRKQQAELAKEYGIYGFCYYYYWFNGKRLLERPLNDILESGEPDFPFCICWANESWTRRWDGADKEVLMPQVHTPDSDEKFIEDVIPILKDKRYISINEAPLLLVYRIDLFPDAKRTTDMWRIRCAQAGIPNIHICAVQSFGITDPRPFGCDSAVEFPPHGVSAAEISSQVNNLDSKFNGKIFDYREVVDRSLMKQKPDYLLYRGVMLGWDNTARRRTSSNIFHYASPEEYQRWLTGTIDYTKRFLPQQNRFIFVNAWNEWAEGTHLEPDEKYGHSYLEATKRALNSK